MKPPTPTLTGVDGSGTAPTTSEQLQPLKPHPVNPGSHSCPQVTFLPFHIREKITHGADMIRFLLKQKEYDNASPTWDLNLTHFVELTESVACRLSPSENQELLKLVKQVSSRAVHKAITMALANTVDNTDEDGGYAALKSALAGLFHCSNILYSSFQS